MEDTTVTMMLVLIAVLVVLGVGAWLYLKRRRSSALRERFGPEYERTVRTVGEPSRAEALLEERARRVEKFDIRPLAPADRDRFADAWRRVQARFVDDPRNAVVDADRLIAEAMRARGYPVEDFDRRAEDLSVHHAGVVEHYRAGRDLTLRHERGEASTEDLRRAMVHFRALFAELVEGGAPVREKEERRAS